MAIPLVADRTDETTVEGIALCLSGGGYRAMLFHLGSLWRLNELSLLPRLNRVSSVSGGSITAAVLAARWAELRFDANGVAASFRIVVDDLRTLARRTIDVPAGIWGILTPGRSISDNVVKTYDEALFKGKTLQDLRDDLPDETPPADATRQRASGSFGPRFVFNATNLQSGSLWRFSKPYMADYQVGVVKRPTVRLAEAVAASSAFPPFLSPFTLRVTQPYESGKEELQARAFRDRVTLSDGGVYDNLGIETAWKRYRTILVSNGGGKLGADKSVPYDWARQSKRVLDVIDNQVRSLRARQVIGAFEAGDRSGAYWGIRTDIANYAVPECLDCPHERTIELADTPTRLAALPEERQQQLINWGYAVTDAAVRRHCSTIAPEPPPAAFPYPESKV